MADTEVEAIPAIKGVEETRGNHAGLNTALLNMPEVQFSKRYISYLLTKFTSIKDLCILE